MSLREIGPTKAGSWASNEAVRRAMLGNRSTNTSPERLRRSELHRRGNRFRLGRQVVAGDIKVRSDIVFSGPRVAVFVDGCFWHSLIHGRRPAANPLYWEQKLSRNTSRDRRVNAALMASGWRVVRSWEHESPALAADQVEQALRNSADALTVSRQIAPSPHR